MFQQVFTIWFRAIVFRGLPGLRNSLVDTDNSRHKVLESSLQLYICS